MAKIAILGFGTVGSGVYEVLCRNAAGVSRRAGEPVEVKYILDPKDFSAHPAANLFIKNFDTILEDPEIRVVVETIGGTRFAYPYVKACLESGRSVCTSNKEMVATYGAELLALAKAHNCAFLFEASVGGGTPIITPMHQCLAANVITEVEGIVNGTTNFMLTKMVRENLGFDEALKIAQELGYAETKDPGDDVDGRDACRKIAILSSLVCGHQIYPQNIPTRGIRAITTADVKSDLYGKLHYEADGMMTAIPGVALVVFSADCIPVLLYDPVRRVIAALHSGWRGTAAGIVTRAVERMEEVYGCRPENILAAIGPGIGPCCFETHEDVPNAMMAAVASPALPFIKIKENGKFSVDLKGINAKRLELAGLEPDHIAVCGDCTACMEDKYWSHRRQGAERGSMAAVIELT